MIPEVRGGRWSRIAGRPGYGPSRTAVLALAVFSILFPMPLAAQAVGDLRKELARQTALPDFPARLSAAVDTAVDVPELLAILAEFVPKLPEGPERRTLLLRWAAVLELSGAWEEAAARYEEAAFSSPGRRDTDSLLSAARAWLAAGETEKALSILRVLGVASPDTAVRMRSLVLEGWARLIEGTAPEARDLAARAAAGSPDREILLSALTLSWAASEGRSREEAGARIRKEFPGTPEAAMVESGAVPPAAHWLLTPAAGASRPPSAPAPGSPAGTPVPGGSGPAAPAASTPRPSGPSGPVPGPVSAAEGSRPEATRVTAYQTGAFSKEANAAALVREMAARGFAPVLERRERGGTPLWVVLVPPGVDAQSTLLRLKDAGYEAYPVF